MNRKKILLTYITEHSGHHRASLAIADALKKESDGKAEIMSIDFSKHLHPLGKWILDKIYLQVLKKSPQTWEHVYDDPKLYAQLSEFVSPLVALKSFKLTKLIEKFKPDVICSTQAFPALILAEFKKQKSLDVPIVGVLTDYSPHRYWVHPNIDLYVVPSKETGDILIKKGAESDRIKNWGIPIASKFFASCVKSKDVLEQLGMSKFFPIILVMGGSLGLGPIKEVIMGFNKFPVSFQVVVICGHNQKLQEELKQEISFLHYPIKILGYVKNVDELMKISSLIISKPGGLTVSECLACNLPMVIINPIPGQEALNTKFLLSHHLAVLPRDGEEAARAAVNLLDDYETRGRMRSRAKIYAKPDAASVIARALIRGWD